MSLETLKYTVTLYFLTIWSYIYSIYKIIKRNLVLRYGSIALIFLIMILLFIFREPYVDENKIPDPYEVLGLERGATKKEIGRKFRRLARESHPDKYPERAKDYERYLNAYQILTDPKKLENYEKYGNPDGPDASFFDIEKIPEALLRPGKKFIIFYFILGGVIVLLPFSLLFIQALKSPPQALQSGVLKHIRAAEKSLVENPKSDVCLQELEKAEAAWNFLKTRFPRYQKCIYEAIFPVRIAVRRAQYLYAQDQEPKAATILQEVKKGREPLLRTKEVQFYIKPFVDDLLETVSSRTRKVVQNRGRKDVNVLEELALAILMKKK